MGTRPRSTRRATAACLAAVALAALPACHVASESAPAADSAAPTSTGDARGGPPFNIFVLVLDSCRADKIGAYGFDRPTMPAFDKLAADPDSVLFRRHYAQGPATKSSTASLFTGLLVRQHHITTHVQFDPSSPVLAADRLDSGLPLLAEYFRRAGYTTFAGVKSYHLIPEYGFARGFDLYFSPRNYNATDFALTDLARALVIGSRSPFFGYFHLNACHYPFEAGLRNPAYMKRYAVAYDEAARRKQGIDFQTAAIRYAIMKGRVRLEEPDVRFLNLIYEAKMRTADRMFLRPILSAFREAGSYDDSMIIVTADHGEELYDHLGYAHGHALWYEVTRVPLVVKFPKGRRPVALGRAVDEPTRTIDLTASLMRIAGGEPPPGATGVSILDGELPSEVISERKQVGWAVARNGFRLIHDRGANHLFRITDDPAETHDVARAEPARLAELMKLAEGRLAELARGSAPAEVVARPVDPKEVEALRRLGYIE